MEEMESLMKQMKMREEAEHFDHADVLAANLESNLGGVSQEQVDLAKQEIINTEGLNLDHSTGRPKTAQAAQNNKSYNTEDVLYKMYELKDGLIAIFQELTLDHQSALKLADQISQASHIIALVGGEYEEFNPLDHVSGLASPDFANSAQKVAENTGNCYKIGSVEIKSISDDGKQINLSFSGSRYGNSYKADGVILASGGWIGNEAVDYVYTPGSGKMSVKAFENGKWIDKSAIYQISYELFEENASAKKVSASKTENYVEETPPEKKEKNIEIDTGKENAGVELKGDFEIHDSA